MKVKTILLKIDPLTWCIIPLKEVGKNNSKNKIIKLFFLCFTIVIQKIKK